MSIETISVGISSVYTPELYISQSRSRQSKWLKALLQTSILRLVSEAVMDYEEFRSTTELNLPCNYFPRILDRLSLRKLHFSSITAWITEFSLLSPLTIISSASLRSTLLLHLNDFFHDFLLLPIFTAFLPPSSSSVGPQSIAALASRPLVFAVHAGLAGVAPDDDVLAFWKTKVDLAEQKLLSAHFSAARDVLAIWDECAKLDRQFVHIFPNSHTDRTIETLGDTRIRAALHFVHDLLLSHY